MLNFLKIHKTCEPIALMVALQQQTEAPTAALLSAP